jgi:hypothetical protein
VIRRKPSNTKNAINFSFALPRKRNRLFRFSQWGKKKTNENKHFHLQKEGKIQEKESIDDENDDENDDDTM